MASPPSPDGLAPYAPDPSAPGYWTYAGLHISSDPGTHKFAVKHAVEHIPKVASVLDIATGEGALARQLLDAGYDRVSCTSWNDKCGLAVPIYKLNLDQPFSAAEVGGRQYGLVCAIEIIEHLENPAAFLRSCRSVVAPDGQMILSTPNVESAQARLQWLVRGTPTMFDEMEITTNRHISMLWGRGLEYLIASAGFTIVKREFVGHFEATPSLRNIPKRFAYQLIHSLCSGDTFGSSRVYVLARRSTEPSPAGPENVY